MNNLIQSIDLQQEKLTVLKHLIKNVETDNNYESTSNMLKALKYAIEDLLETDF